MAVDPLVAQRNLNADSKRDQICAHACTMIILSQFCAVDQLTLVFCLVLTATATALDFSLSTSAYQILIWFTISFFLSFLGGEIST